MKVPTKTSRFEDISEGDLGDFLDKKNSLNT